MSIKKMVVVAFAGLFILYCSGCATSVGHMKGQSTDVGVALTHKNYRMIKASATGESTGFSLLGIIPFKSPTYSEAKNNLYNSVDIPIEGKAVALVNQTEDHSCIYLILCSIPKLTLNADIIEYLE